MPAVAATATGPILGRPNITNSQVGQVVAGDTHVGGRRKALVRGATTLTRAMALAAMFGRPLREGE